ncbi:MAG: DUF368 domain-containing protein [Clostridia bacterium]|nr:DUF368 domain-containing protein [Clostridia bacterium]
MKFIKDCLKGIALGAGAILPGISSGVLCVIFGIYEKLLNSILDFFKDIKGNIKFLFPILLGITIGIIIFGNVLRFLFETFPFQTQYSFIGLILGGLPILFKTANSKKGFRLHYILYMLISFFIALVLIFFENTLPENTLMESSETNFIFLVLSGFMMSIGVVIPGISSSIILMLLGSYNIYLFSISTLNLPVLLPMGIGLLIGGLLFLILIKYLLKNFHPQTYYTIIGFVLGSIFILYPGFKFDFDGITSILFLIGGFFISNLFEKSEKEVT